MRLPLANGSLSVNYDPAVYAAIMIPVAVPSAIMVTFTANYHSSAGAVFGVSTRNPAIMVTVTNSDVQLLCERRDCNAQSHYRRKKKKTAAHCTISFELRPL